MYIMLLSIRTTLGSVYSTGIILLVYLPFYGAESSDDGKKSETLLTGMNQT